MRKRQSFVIEFSIGMGALGAGNQAGWLSVALFRFIYFFWKTPPSLGEF
jgi:hypothetical protein